ncbi:MAG: envelope fusion protein [Candidatus Thiodiazotropha endolucinida]|nr:envelope fusion protein [Candidatus Thiodiazotropha taylori]MCW4344244.1 envelope fusion protein [Candidatus Thiodiazotropha endolucinida]
MANNFRARLKTIQIFLTHVAGDIEQVANITKVMLDHYNGPKQQSFTNTLKNLHGEVESLDVVLDGIFQSYTDYRSLGKRTERSLLPIGGKIMSFLFGTVSESEIEDVRRAINELSKNQLDILHILEEQMSILNVTKVQVNENRMALLDLVKCVNLLDARLRALTETIQKRFEKVETFINVYAQMDLIISGIKDAILRANFYLENLRLELNMLSLNHLSPSLITPQNLKQLLLAIKTKLPFSLKLPEDPVTNIWYFYRTLICKAVLDKDKLLVIINLPLLDQNGEYEVFRIHALPLPWVQTSSGEKIPNLVATYEVQYTGLLINKERSRYALLDADEVQACTNAVMRYCTPRNAVLPVNLHQHCALALFLKDDAKVDKYCRKLVTPNAMLPRAKYLFVGQWVIALRESLTFSIVCTENGGQRSTTTQHTKTLEPPLDVITLQPGCSGSSNLINLPPYYQFEDYVSVKDPFSNLIELKNKSKFRIWDKVEEALPHFTKIELPENLTALKQIPMTDLIWKLRGMRKVELKDNSWPMWAYVIINGGICILGGALVFLYIRYRKNKKTLNIETPGCCARLFILCSGGDKVDKGEPRDQVMSVSYTRGTEEVNILPDRDQSVPPNGEVTSDSFLRHLYPSLSRVAK